MKLQDSIVKYINENQAVLNDSFPDFIKDIRTKSQQDFIRKGFPSQKNERWRKTKLKYFTEQYYHPSINNIYDKELKWEACVVPEFDMAIALINGHYVAKKDLEVLPNGIIIGSMKSAVKKYPDLVKSYFNRLIKQQNNVFDDFNAGLFTDGLFLYVPKNVQGFKLQIIHRLDAKIDALINVRNLVILEENSQIDMIQCDDSNQHKSHFASFNSEVFLADKANLNWYKYQNINDLSAVFSNHYYQVGSQAHLYTNFMELNGKLLRNEQFAKIVGVDAKVDLYGLYLADKSQQVDNLLFVTHEKEGSYSNQKFKGILDDSARGFFNGQILVKKDAQQTNAFQKNDSIILTDKARVSSQPFLEIYADDVSCSHGSTTGQIDEEALFYIRQRGISKRDAQLLQLYAFVGEVIDAIKIPELIEPTKDLVKKRLNGKLDVCEDCILQCQTRT